MKLIARDSFSIFWMGDWRHNPGRVIAYFTSLEHVIPENCKLTTDVLILGCRKYNL